jgi:hypothetical protein
MRGHSSPERDGRTPQLWPCIPSRATTLGRPCSREAGMYNAIRVRFLVRVENQLLAHLIRRMPRHNTCRLPSRMTRNMPCD